MDESYPKSPNSQRQQRKSGEFVADNGKVRYCLDCDRVIVDFGGFHLHFHRSGFAGFLSCLQESIPELSGYLEDGKIRIGPKDRDGYISLDPEQVPELALLMETAALIMDAELPT